MIGGYQVGPDFLNKVKAEGLRESLKQAFLDADLTVDEVAGYYWVVCLMRPKDETYLDAVTRAAKEMVKGETQYELQGNYNRAIVR